MIPFLRPNKPNLDLFNNYLKDSVEQNHYTNFGVNHNRLKSKFQEITGIQNVVLTCNATVILDGLHRLLSLCDKAYLPSFTFPATNQGCNIPKIYSDTILQDNNIGRPYWVFDQIKHTYAVTYAMSVNPFGSIASPSKRPPVDFWFIDNAAGLLTQAKEWLDADADAVVYSLHATKILSACEGGVVFFSSTPTGQKLFEEYSNYINFGIVVDKGLRSIGTQGSNHKMSELSAAWCLMNLGTYDKDVLTRKVIANAYIDFCKQENVIYIPSLQAFWILGKANNLIIQEKAKEYGVEIRPYYEKLPSVSMQENTKLFNSKGFCIPTYSIEYIDPVVELLKELKGLDFI